MYVTHKAYDHVEWKKRKEERNSRGKSTTQRRDKTDKARSASSEGAPSKGVANYTREDQIELDAALEAVLFTSNLPQEQHESIMARFQGNKGIRKMMLPMTLDDFSFSSQYLVPSDWSSSYLSYFI